MANQKRLISKAQSELYSLVHYIREAPNAIKTRHLSRASLEACNLMCIIAETCAQTYLEDCQLVVEVSFYRKQTLPGFTLSIDGAVVFSYENDDRRVDQGGSVDSNT